MGKIIFTYWKNLIAEAFRTMWVEWGISGLVVGFIFSGIYALVIREQTFSWAGILVFANTLFWLIIISWVIFVFKVAATQDKSKGDRIMHIDNELNSVIPNIQLQDGMSIRDIVMGDLFATIFPAPISLMVTIPFANNPKSPNLRNDSQKVRAEITYLDENKTPLFKPITGRWGGLQPPEIFGSDRRILESTDFPNNGAFRWLDLLFKYPEDEYCYAYNNDSYGRPFFQHPEYEITKKRFFVRVRLKGAHVPDNIWEFEVITNGKGDTFQIRKNGEKWQPRVKSQATKNLPQQTTKKKSSRKKSSSKP